MTEPSEAAWEKARELFKAYPGSTGSKVRRVAEFVQQVSDAATQVLARIERAEKGPGKLGAVVLYDDETTLIETSEGQRAVICGEWIVRGKDGGIYVAKEKPE